MKALLKYEKRRTMQYLCSFFLIIVLIVSIFTWKTMKIYHSYLHVNPTGFQSISITIEGQTVNIERNNHHIWTTGENGYFIDEQWLTEMYQYIQKYPLEKTTLIGKEQPDILVDLKDQFQLTVQSYLPEKDMTLVSYKNEKYLYPANLRKMFPPMAENYYCKTLLPSSIQKKITKVQIEKEEQRTTIKKDNSVWKNRDTEETITLINPILESAIDGYLPMTGINTTEDYRKIQARFITEKEEYSYYFYYPENGKGITYIVSPAHNMTLLSRSISTHLKDL